MIFLQSVNYEPSNILRVCIMKEVIDLRDKLKTADVPGVYTVLHSRLKDGKYVFNMKRRQKC